MAKNCMLDQSVFTTKRSGKIKLRATTDLSKELGLSPQDVIENYGRYAGCVGLQMIKQEQARGAMQEPILTIGGRPSNDPYSATPNQRIRYIDRNIAEIGNVGMMVLQALIEKSPVGPPKDETRVGPHYYDCHILMVNGREWKPGDETLKVTDTVQIVNTRIYARRIEQGWSMQAPGGVYRPVFRWARRTFGNSFTVRFGYRPLSGVRPNQVRRYKFPRVSPGVWSKAGDYGKTGWGAAKGLSLIHI